MNMKKKILSVLLSLTMVLGTGMTAFASTTPPPNAGNGKVLLDTEVFPVVDDQGNKVDEITVDSYIIGFINYHI